MNFFHGGQLQTGRGWDALQARFFHDRNLLCFAKRLGFKILLEILGPGVIISQLQVPGECRRHQVLDPNMTSRANNSKVNFGFTKHGYGLVSCSVQGSNLPFQAFSTGKFICLRGITS